MDELQPSEATSPESTSRQLTQDGIDLNELFYSGAGMSNYSLTEEEAKDFLNASGAEEIHTDMVHLTTAQIDAFLLEKRLGTFCL